MKQDEKADLTQTQIFSEQLKKIAIDVTAADRKAFLELHHEDSDDPISSSSLSNYLRGKVYDNDTAVTVIRFFKKCIENRFQKTSN